MARFLIILFCVLLGVTLLFCMPVHADIYHHVDTEGIVHFTNVPTTSGYRIYMREGAFQIDDEASGRYDRYILEAAEKHGVSFSLIKAVIKAESDFNADAVSRAGACGLMQIMPRTAEELGISDPFDPRENILGGVRYLKGLLTRFQGRLPLVLAAYNAGPSRVESLMCMPPFEETRNFVERVMQYIERY
ncbi:MAG: hypothetical protein BA861_08155 [Desulfobacterales bacterium S3730MH5]|nr:MAG: hypothetical protein BA861_08155 [Desulfobacterales bacterium S3730MH5]OEU80824.1 MAG: hypothetical protein BA865_11440 [Desulfobacterales bacterium S5133MH4]